MKDLDKTFISLGLSMLEDCCDEVTGADAEQLPRWEGRLALALEQAATKS